MTVRDLLKTIPNDMSGCGVIPDSKGVDINEIFQQIWAISEHRKANPDTPVEMIFPTDEAKWQFIEWCSNTKEFMDYVNQVG